MLQKDASTRTGISTRLVLGVGAVGAVAFALGFGTGSLDLARLGAPSGVILQAAQIGLGSPAHAAEPVAGAAYLPAILHADSAPIEAPAPQF